MKNFYVLVVANSPVYGSLVASMIERSFEGCQVDMVDTPIRAFKLLKAVRYQIVISDLDLGCDYHNGLEILLKMRNQLFRPGTILMFRDFATECQGVEFDEDYELLAALASVDRIWKKPVAIERLKDTISELLVGRKDICFD